MPLLEQETALRKPPASQADAVGRDVNRWAWDGLCVALPFLEAGPAGWRDIITGVQPTPTGTITGGRDNRGQVVVTTDGGSNYLDYADQPSHQRPATELTACCRIRYSGAATVENDSIFGKVYTSGSEATWAMYSSSAAANMTGIIKTTEGVADPSTEMMTSLVTGAFSNVFLRWRAGETLCIDAFKDGGELISAQKTSNTTISGTIVYNPGQPLRVYASDTTRGVPGDLSTMLVYARRLTDTECRALAVDPFLPFRRPLRGSGRLAGEPPSWTAGQTIVG